MGIQKLSWRARIALAGGLLCAIVGGLALAIDTPADALLGEIRSIEVPEIAPEAQKNPQVVQRVAMMRQAAMEHRAILIGELYKLDPDRPELAKLLPLRWQVMLSSEKPEDAVGEIERSLRKGKEQGLVQDATFYKIVNQFREASKSGVTDGLKAAVDDFTARYPRDKRGAEVLDALSKTTQDVAVKSAITAKLVANYPESPMTKLALIEKRRLDGAGKPFEFGFVDAIKGERVTSESLKGKIIVVDFWATWCAPCVAAMPELKSLYAQYKDQGVEFIGISQDLPPEQGGLENLKKFVSDNGIEWPQYYDGKPSSLEFSMDWGIVAIPALFVVDSDGKIVSTEARGKLDLLIPELLAKRQGQTNP